MHIPLDELPKRHTEIPDNKDLLVFYKSGARSKAAINILQSNRFKKELVSLKGGLQSGKPFT